SNKITIEGSTSLAYSDDIKKRFKAYNWNIIEIDAHDYDQIEKAVRKAQREKNRPSIIVCNSHIGQGSPNKVDTASAHGEPLGEDEIRATKRNLGMPEDKDFYVPDGVRELFEARGKKMKRLASKWGRAFKKYCDAYPDKAELLRNCMEDNIPEDLEKHLPEFELGKAIASRSASGKVIQAMAGALPQLVGGSADLAPSTKTLIDGAESVGPNAFGGKNLHFGVREHAMGALMNGMALHGGFRVFGATFFVFSDYCRPAIRLAAIMGLPVIYVFTHDSFYVGEDGPTHQPVEHVAALRCIPNVTVIRPADPTETGMAWIAALENKTGPTALLFTRQNLDVIDRSKYAVADGLKQGAYTLWQSGEGCPDVILLASGSEVNLVLSAAQELADDYNVRVVSMPSWELFEKQSESYRESVLPNACEAKVVVEAGSGQGWEKYVGNDGCMICMTGFGKSGPYKELVEKYGFTVENVTAVVRQRMGSR
ncbi:MAG: transketolase, partial [Kiritimatiellae bacterium]|nr:transketolase [Kiritimatiellia bacterium]